MAFLLFIGQDFYPHGGALDLFGSFNDLAEAFATIQSEAVRSRIGSRDGWAHVWSLEQKEIVKAWTATHETIPYDPAHPGWGMKVCCNGWQEVSVADL